MRSVGRIAVRTGNHTKQILEQIYLMRSQVVEIAAARNIRLQSPGHFLAALKVEIARRNREAHLNIHHVTDGSALDNLLHLLEVRKITAIVSYEAGNTRLLADAVDADAVVVTRSQELLPESLPTKSSTTAHSTPRYLPSTTTHGATSMSTLPLVVTSSR